MSKETKVIVKARLSFANIWEPRSSYGQEPKYSVSCVIPKSETAQIEKIKKAVEAAKQEGKEKKWSGKIPANLKLPFRDGDIDRPDDETYADSFFINASSKDAPQIVDRHVQLITDPMMVYSGCICNVSINFYPFSANGNKGIAAGLGNIQFVADGPRLSGKASASSEFGEVDDGEDGGLFGDDTPDYL
ncbi:MAG TPA: DUF2815 family protein [Lachnospiraceae bacterium]|jgi:hypothetical protein|nr:DUF2815 family protein [Lachnospiraceae bacterium]